MTLSQIKSVPKLDVMLFVKGQYPQQFNSTVLDPQTEFSFIFDNIEGFSKVSDFDYRFEAMGNGFCSQQINYRPRTYHVVGNVIFWIVMALLVLCAVGLARVVFVWVKLAKHKKENGNNRLSVLANKRHRPLKLKSYRENQTGF